MFRFREFRASCKNGETSDIIEAMQQCLDFEHLDDYFKACNYISELINSNDLTLNKELLNFLYDFNVDSSFEIALPSKGRRIGIIIKSSGLFPVELLSSINRTYFTPVVILIGRTLDNSKFAITLSNLDIAFCQIETELNLIQQLESLSAAIEQEKLSKLILHANPADLDFLVLSRCTKNLTTFHSKIPLITDHTYCEHEDSLGKGSWKRNKALPLFERFTAVYVADGEKIPIESFKYISDSKLILLNNDPLQCLEGLDEKLIEQVLFITKAEEYSEGLKSSKELLVSESNFSKSIDLAFKYGLALRFIETGRHIPYQEVLEKFDLKNKFTGVLASIYQTKLSFRKQLPRILLFRNDASAPVIESININISAALKHAGCPVLDIDIGPMAIASRTKDWQSLKSIQLQIMDQIHHFNPDAALGYNAVGIFPNGDSHILEKQNIPYYGLFFDNPFFFMDKLKCCKDKSLTRILTLDKYFIEALKQDGFSETYYFPIATSMHHNSLANHKSFNSESFLFTSTIKEIRSSEEVGLEVDSKNDREFINYAFKEILENQCFDIDTILSHYSHFYSKDYKRFHNEIWFRIENQCSSQLRIQTMEAIKDFPVEIYGGGNWNKIELSSKHNFNGRLSYNDLHEASRQSYGTICRTPLTIQNGIQQRILDCGAAKGFILTDYRPVLEEHFELDKELFVYRNNEELKEKVAFLQKNPKAIKESIELLHKKVLEQHTWDVRIQELINLILG